MIGIIIPPAQIKKLVETTAQHVALNGSDFQKILIEREQHKPQFAFLRIDSPYRPYYDHRVAEISKKLLQGISTTQNMQPENTVKQEPVPQPQTKQNQTVAQQQQLLEKIFFELKQPQPEKYIAQIPQKLSEAEQAIIQHTAQYAAKNGKNFLIALSQRQKNNPQFEFLRTSSKYNPYFVNVMTAYTNILQMSEDEVNRIQKYIKSRDEILKKCREVFDYYNVKQQQSRGKKETVTNQTKESNIDWNDFQLVETISFDTEQHKNINNAELLARIQQNAAAQLKNMQETIISQPKKRQILQQCHACRQNILASQMNKHLKTCLALGKKKVGTENMIGEEVDISKNLQHLSSKRPDIFGTRQNSFALKQDEKEQGQKVIFDGQAPNLSRTTGSVAMLHYQQKKLKEENQNNKK